MAADYREHRKDLGERLFDQIDGGEIPEEFEVPNVCYVTGWTPDYVREMDAYEVELHMLFRAVRDVNDHGGTLEL